MREVENNTGKIYVFHPVLRSRIRQIYRYAVAVALVSGPEGLSYAKDSNWLAFGDLRGHIEPCGCDPRTDLGGVARLATHIGRDRALAGDVLVLDLGNNLSEDAGDSTKNYFINNALDEISPDASLVDSQELLSRDGTLHRTRPTVLSNAIGPPIKSKVIAAKGRLIFGYLWIEAQKDKLASWKLAFGPSWKRQYARPGSPPKILLFSGPDDQLKEIAAAGLFDEIIASNRNPKDALIADAEKLRPGLLLRLSNPMEVYQVPLGGQGVIRGGTLRSQASVSLASLMKPKLAMTASTAIKTELPEVGEVVTWLGPEFAIGSPLSQLMEDYKQSRGKEFEQMRLEKLAHLKVSPFVGAAICKNCHNAEWTIWTKSAHASADSTLVKKEKHQDPECVNCHVLGFSVKGGFVSMTDSPQFGSVQCENCHGPGGQHSQNPSIKISPSNRDVCASCHLPPHSADFQFDAYWPKIRHGKKP